MFLRFVLLNTLPGVSTQRTSLVVVVCEHGVSPALKNPEELLSIVSVPHSSSTFFCHVHSLFSSYELISITFLRTPRSLLCDQAALTRDIYEAFRDHLRLGTTDGINQEDNLPPRDFSVSPSQNHLQNLWPLTEIGVGQIVLFFSRHESS